MLNPNKKYLTQQLTSAPFKWRCFLLILPRKIVTAAIREAKVTYRDRYFESSAKAAVPGLLPLRFVVSISWTKHNLLTGVHWASQIKHKSLVIVLLLARPASSQLLQLALAANNNNNLTKAQTSICSSPDIQRKKRLFISKKNIQRQC